MSGDPRVNRCREMKCDCPMRPVCGVWKDLAHLVCGHTVKNLPNCDMRTCHACGLLLGRRE